MPLCPTGCRRTKRQSCSFSRSVNCAATLIITYSGSSPSSDLLGHSVDAVEAVTTLRRLLPVLVTAGGELADEQPNQDEEQFGGQVGLVVNSERLEGDGQEEVERGRRHQRGTAQPPPGYRPKPRRR